VTAHKVADLTGPLLDAAVAKADGLEFAIESQMTMTPRPTAVWLTTNRKADFSKPSWRPSVDWSQGGQIIERERVLLEPSYAGDPYPEDWLANIGPQNYDGHYRRVTTYRVTQLGPTPLIAAMRAYVASRFGATVQLP
jgi:hypothetical protein